MSRRALLRLGLFHLGAGAASVLFLGVLNRVLYVEMGLDLLLVGARPEGAYATIFIVEAVGLALAVWLLREVGAPSFRREAAQLSTVRGVGYVFREE